MDLDAIDKYYNDSLKTFIELGKVESEPRTDEELKKVDEINDDSSSETTSSNSDLDFGKICVDAVPDTNNVKLKSQHVPNFSECEENFASLAGISNINYLHRDDDNINLPSRVGSIQNSSDIQIGNKTIFNGPTTFNIKQIVLPNDKNNQIGKTNKGSNEGFKEMEMKDDQSSQNESTSSLKGLIFSQKPYSWLLLSIVVTILMIGLVYFLITYTMYEKKLEENYSKLSKDSNYSNLPPQRVLRMISRKDWLAQPPNNVLDDLEIPVNRIIITHTATEMCETQAACTLSVRIMQTFHMESRGWDDIGYNFIIGGDGAVYEGRGWDKQGAHTLGWNKGSIGVAFIGTFTKQTPPERQLKASFQLFEKGVGLKKLDENYKIYAHRQLIATESPGEAFYGVIKTWPHWTDKLPET